MGERRKTCRVGGGLVYQQILVVEDSYLLADTIAELIRDWSMEPVGHVVRLEEEASRRIITGKAWTTSIHLGETPRRR
jgi:hypothetical protein